MCVISSVYVIRLSWHINDNGTPTVPSSTSPRLWLTTFLHMSFLHPISGSLSMLAETCVHRPGVCSFGFRQRVWLGLVSVLGKGGWAKKACVYGQSVWIGNMRPMWPIFTPGCLCRRPFKTPAEGPLQTVFKILHRTQPHFCSGKNVLHTKILKFA